MKTNIDIYKEFLTKGIKEEQISDYRRCIAFYGFPSIPNAIIVWLKDGTTIIYQTKTERKEQEEQNA